MLSNCVRTIVLRTIVVPRHLGLEIDPQSMIRELVFRMLRA